jgi:hypothetical protein
MPSSPDRSARLRVGWVDGRPLATADLCDAADYGALLRARHVLGAHRTWGVVWGLVARLRTREELATVTPGLAYNACGAELGVSSPVELTLPEPLPDGTTLCVHDAGGGCAAFAWRPPGGVRPGADVPLGLLRTEPGTALDRGACRRAASQRRPALRAGTLTRPLSDFTASDAGGVRTLRVGFDAGPGASLPATPRVFATVRVLAEDAAGDGVPALFAGVADVGADGFTLRVVVADGGGGQSGVAGAIDIAWLAVGERDDTEELP